MATPRRTARGGSKRRRSSVPAKRVPARPAEDAVHERFMALAVEEARRGLGRTAPNPVVGAVIVKGGEVIARGHHRKAGTAHAEVNALRAAGNRAKGADLYTTLEPCDHFGRTPPCSLAILEAGIARVFSGSADPNPLVNGKGIARLKRAGVKVVQGVLRDQADALNRPFFKYVRTRRPFVTLKAAVSLDGKLATASGDSKWVTGEAARQRVHQLRNEADVVMVGANTVERDDPQLTTRMRGGRDAVRLVVDSSLRLSPRQQIFLTPSKARTIVATVLPEDAPAAKVLREQGITVWTLPAKADRVDLGALLDRLGSEGLLHVLVEGGAELFGSFLREGLADELWLFLAPKLVGDNGLTWAGALGVQEMAQALSLEPTSIEVIGEDFLLTARLGSRRSG